MHGHAVSLDDPGMLAAAADAPPLAGAGHAITRWISEFVLVEDDPAALLGGLCERLVAAGLPLLRVAAGTTVFHPTIDGRGLNWRRGRAIESEETERDGVDTSRFDSSPFRRLLEEGSNELRRTVGRDWVPGEFGLLDRFVAEGCIDYLAFVLRYRPGTAVGPLAGVALSFQTDRPAGFAEAELALLRAIAPAIGHGFKTMACIETARTLVTTYLGRDPGRRVLDGTIERGRAERVQAVLWSSDLVGFTRLTETLPHDQVLGLLNEYADCLVGVITGHGGEVLKFIGDGIIAIFPVAGAEAALPCGPALDAAEAALAAVATLGARRAAAGLARSGVHLALHVGQVLYGNIGSRDRLDFTVIGPAVNELARIETMCRSLDQRLVVSAAFAAAAPPATRARLVSLGRYALKGVRRPEELFTLDMEAVAAPA